MTLVLSLFIVAAMLCFLACTAYKAWRYLRYPPHSRLELYPVPKEGAGRAAYGGSYFEEAQWWAKPRALNKTSETKDILKEMLFIRKLFVNNKRLWVASYLFHLGIYALCAWTILLILATLLPVAFLCVIATIAGALGFTLATLGCAALLARRIFDAQLRCCTTPLEYGNLILLLFVLVTGCVSWLAAMSPFDAAATVLHLSGAGLPALVVVHLIALGVLLVYIPLSKMSHYVGKFFAFHKVLWDNDPNSAGSAVNERLKTAERCTAQTAWGAPHAATPPAAAPPAASAAHAGGAMHADSAAHATATPTTEE